MTTIRQTLGGLGAISWPTIALAATPVIVAASALAVTAIQQSGVTVVPAGSAVDAGADQTITLPTNQVTLTGRINGVTARWVTRAGAGNSVVQSPTSATTLVTFSQPGTYKFELQSFDARGRSTGTDSVKIFVQKAVAGNQWRERIIGADGKINAAEYRYVATHINEDAIVDYRLGPKYADFSHNGEAPTPTVWGPDLKSGQGLWPYGTQPVSNPGEPEKCLPPSQQPRSDPEELQRGLKGAGWLVAGQHIFVPENLNDPDYRFGVSNTRGADGAVFDTGGLCMRMTASWNYDWWNRNGIAQPYNSQVRDLAARRADLPLVPVAIARGRANASQISFAAFKDGTIAVMSVGNTAPEFLDTSELRLPAGMVPTAMAVTPYNEFLVVSVWDTNTVSGKLAFIALRPREMANGSPEQTGGNTRWYWGVAGAWTNRGMKLLGMVDLPFAAPSSIDVSNNLVLQNPRGYDDNNNPARGDLARQSARDIWRQINPIYAIGGNHQLGIENQQWSQMASAGYAVVASRAENKAAFVDMTPLYQFFRQMYLTDQAHYDRTVDQSVTDPKKWPFAFSAAPEEMPQVVATIDVSQPTSVSAGVQANGALSDRSSYIFEFLQRSPRDAWSGVEPERYLARGRAFVASMDGTVRIFNVQGLNLPGSPLKGSVPVAPIGTFQAGRNPRFAFVNASATASDDLWLISRGDRRVTFAFPTGAVQYSFTDSRMVDPVGGAVSINQAGYGGSGAGRAVFSTFVSITDYNGKAIMTYAVEPRRDAGGPTGELYPFRDPNGPVNVLFGSVARFPGKPFMIDLEEII